MTKQAKILFIRFAFFLTTVLATPLGHACLLSLKRTHSPSAPLLNPTLCEISDRYRFALKNLGQQGVKSPERIADLLAPRFIESSLWFQTRRDDAAVAWNIYKPAPQTWLSWDSTAQMVYQNAQTNLAAQKIPPLDLDSILALHKKVLNGLSRGGYLRSGTEVGMAFSHVAAISEKERKALVENEYRGSSQEALMSWHPTLCLEDHDENFRNNFGGNHINLNQWPEIPDNQYFIVSADVGIRQCGYIKYPPPLEIKKQLEALLNFVNDAFLSWSDPLRKPLDPLMVAAKAQKWFITIHPFLDGNGRTSRLLMDYILQSLGLPAPILEDMDADLFTSEKIWATTIGKGVFKALKLAEGCAMNPRADGCQPIPEPQ